MGASLSNSAMNPSILVLVTSFLIAVNGNTELLTVLLFKILPLIPPPPTPRILNLRSVTGINHTSVSNFPHIRLGISRKYLPVGHMQRAINSSYGII